MRGGHRRAGWGWGWVGCGAEKRRGKNKKSYTQMTCKYFGIQVALALRRSYKFPVSLGRSSERVVVVVVVVAVSLGKSGGLRTDNLTEMLFKFQSPASFLKAQRLKPGSVQEFRRLEHSSHSIKTGR